jgi:molecular chaperone Hsp33
MKNKDQLQRFLFENTSVRGEIVHLDTTCQDILLKHDYPPFIQRILSEALVLVSLLMGIIKLNGRITLQFQNQFGLKLLLAQINQSFEMRALAQWDEALTEETLLKSMQQGVLVIMMDPDASTQRYQGIVAWRGTTLRESIEGYFRDSEQLATRIWLAIGEQSAAGLLLQVMPEDEKKRQVTEHEMMNPDWEHLVHITETIKPEELLELDFKTVLHRLFHEEDLRLFDPFDISFKCTCSRKRGENAILLLGEEEAQQELLEHQAIIVRCDFCNDEFVFDKVDVANIFRQGGSASSSTLIH